MDFFEQLEKGRFGSFELKHQVGPNLLKGLLVSLLIHGSVIASPLIYQVLRGKEVVVVASDPGGRDTLVVVMHKPVPPRPWHQYFDPSPPKKPERVIPRPVEDEPSDSAKLVPTTEEIGRYQQYYSDSIAGLGAGDGDLTGLEIPEDPILPIDTFVLVEVEPQPFTTNPQPAYPELAMKAGVGGKVIVQFFVDKAGKVRRSQIAKVDPSGLGFDEEVLKIIPEWKFTPALQAGKPVGVWVAVPFRFKVEK